MFQIQYSTFEETARDYKVNQRSAIKGVAIKNGSILLIKTKKGDLKFPGGGSKTNETHEATLMREFLEETGYTVVTTGPLLGVVTERKIDDYEANAVFEMKSLYYGCEISDDAVAQRLDEYEAEQEFNVCFVSLFAAWQHNNNLLLHHKDNNLWLRRETDVMRKLLEQECQ